MSNLTVNIPHQLGRAEARRRIQQHFGQIRQQHGNLFQKVDEHWDGDTLDFGVTAMGQSITGKLFVEDTAVRVEVALPWVLSMFGGPVKEALEQQGKKLLGGPKTAPPG